MINIISNLNENATLEKCYTFNQVVAWFLHDAFKKIGIESRLINDHYLLSHNPPKSTHTLIISAAAMSFTRAKPSYIKKIRNHSKEKVALYLDADFSGWDKYFDYIFTVVKPRTQNLKYVYAGWGADPTYCFPEQKEKAVFLDALMWGKYSGTLDYIYEIYDKTLPTLGPKIYNVLPTYHNYRRIPWVEMQKILRKCHYYCCTQIGESGLTRIEAATCGALLVVPKPMYRPRTMASLEHIIWETKEDLIAALKLETNPKEISEKAKKHSWNLVAQRIINRISR